MKSRRTTEALTPVIQALLILSCLQLSSCLPTPKPSYVSNYTIFDKEFLMDLAANDKRLGHGYRSEITSNHILCYCSHHHVERDVSEVLNPYRPDNMKDVELCIGTFCFGGKHFVIPANDEAFHEEDFGAHDTRMENFNMILFCRDELHNDRECCTTNLCNHQEFRDEIKFPMQQYNVSKVEKDERICNCPPSTVAFWTHFLSFAIGAIFAGSFACTYSNYKKHMNIKIYNRIMDKISKKPRVTTPSSCNSDNIPLTQQNRDDDQITVITNSTRLTPDHSLDGDHSGGSGGSCHSRPKSITPGELMSQLDNTMSMGSGSGAQQLRELTLAHQLNLEVGIGCGRFGEVFRGTFRGSAVAIKMFAKKDIEDFYHEASMFTGLTHPNVVRYYGHDNREMHGDMQYFMITEYHENGSVGDYLQKNTVSDVTMFNMIRSIADGLSYLHSDIPNIRGPENDPKRPIAHRDMKSTNILVKRDLTCCIADLGLSVKFDGATANVDYRPTSGTVRYHAPELLDQDCAVVSFDFYIRSDIYAMGLVMWEICRRTQTDTVRAYDPDESIPYYNRVPRDPSDEDMRAIVLDEGYRPEIPKEWNSDPLFSRMANLMRECWTFNPTARRNATSVRVACDACSRDLNLKINN